MGCPVRLIEDEGCSEAQLPPAIRSHIRQPD